MPSVSYISARRGDYKRTLLFSLVPIRERGVVDAEGEAFVGLIDAIGTEMGQAASNDRLVFFGRSARPIVGGEFRKIHGEKRDHISATGVEYEDAFRIGTKGVGFDAALFDCGG